MKASRPVLLSSVFGDQETAALAIPEFKDPQDFKITSWMCYYTALMPITDWLIRGVAPHIRVEFFNSFMPDLYKPLPACKVSPNDAGVYYKRGIGQHTPIGTQFPAFHVTGSEYQKLRQKGSQNMATYLRTGKSGSYKVSAAVGLGSFTAQLARPLVYDPTSYSNPLEEEFSVVRSYGLVVSPLTTFRNSAKREAAVKKLGLSFFDVQKPYHETFKLNEPFSNYLRRAIDVDPIDLIASLLEELEISDWVNSCGVDGYDDDPDSFTNRDLATAYLKWLDDSITEYDLISAPMTQGTMNTFDDEQGKAVSITSLSDKNLVTAKPPTSVMSEGYSSRDFFVDSVISARDVTLQVMLDMPKDVATFATQSPDKNVDEYHLLQLVNKPQLELEHFEYGRVGLGDHTDATYAQISMDRTVDVLKMRKPPKSLGVNEKGLAFQHDGTIVYIPTHLDKVAEQRADIAAYFDGQQFKSGTRIIGLRDPFDIPGNRRVFDKDVTDRPRPDPSAIGVRMSYVDWGLGILMGTDSTGSQTQLLDIRHLTPVTDSSFANYQNAALYPIMLSNNLASRGFSEILNATKPNQYSAITNPLKTIVTSLLASSVSADDLKAFAMSNLRDLFQGVKINGETYNLIEDDRLEYFATGIGASLKFQDPISTMSEYSYNAYMVAANRAKVLLGSELPAEMDDIVSISDNGLGDYFTLKHLAEGWTTNPSLLTRLFGFVLSKIWAAVDGRIEVFTKVTSISLALHYYGTLAAIADLLENPRTLTLNRYDTTQQVPADYVPEPLPGSVDGYSMLPHQLRVDKHMKKMVTDNGIKFRILYAMAGAGKTHNLLNDVMRLLQEGEIKKPLIICPNYLIKNYIEDAAYIYGGRLNVIPLDTEIKNYSPRMGNSESLGLEGLLTMIENAPPNTVFVTSYTFLSAGNNSAVEVPIGVSVAFINPTIEMMLESAFDYVGADESHELRNANTIKWESCLTLFYRAKHRVIATGTFLNTSPSDIPSQTVMLDPTVFGSHTHFFEYYADTENSGSTRISKLIESRKDELVESMRTAVGYIQVKRKEWSALLPSRKDSYHIMKLDPESTQWKVYQAILNQVLTEIKKILEQNKSLAKDADDGDEGAEENLDKLLKPYLQRLEQLLITPALDTDFERIVAELDGEVEENYVSPGVERCIEIIEAHLNGVNLDDGLNGMTKEERFHDVKEYLGLSDEDFFNGKLDTIPRTPGKILVFCNYKTSVKAVYDALPPHLQKRAIQYDAKQKDKHIFEFKNNPEKDILIGIHTSLATGHNFQFCTRLIRLEQVWSPGEVEQGESRINRPDPKNKGAKRSQIYYDWIVIDGTIQITKLARLISRMVVNTQVEEHGNPAYDDVRYLSLLKMTLGTIQNNCWFKAPSDEQAGVTTERSLITYLETKHQIDMIQQQEFDDFRENYEGATEAVEVPSGPILKGSKVITNIPPIPGQVIANADKFSLVNVSKYETEVGSQDVDLVGMRCYTSEGDGEIIAMKGSKLHVRVGGVKYSFDRLAVNLYLDPSFSREDLLKATGIKDVVTIKGSQDSTNILRKPKSKPDDLLSDDDIIRELEIDLDKVGKKTSKKQLVSPEDLYSQSVDFLKSKVVKTKKADPMPQPTDSDSGEADGEIEVIASNTNGALCLMLSSEDADLTDRKSTIFLKKLGFHLEPDSWYAEIPTRKALEDVLAKFESKFDIPEKVLEKWYDLVDTFSVGRRKLFNADQASALEIKEYWLMDYKRVLRKDPDVLVPIPLVQDGDLYMVLDMQLPSSKRAKRLRVSNINWETSGGLWMKLYSKKTECAADLRELQKRYNVLDKDELKRDIKEVIITNKKVGK